MNKFKVLEYFTLEEILSTKKQCRYIFPIEKYEGVASIGDSLSIVIHLPRPFSTEDDIEGLISEDGIDIQNISIKNVGTTTTVYGIATATKFSFEGFIREYDMYINYEPFLNKDFTNYFKDYIGKDSILISDKYKYSGINFTTFYFNPYINEVLRMTFSRFRNHYVFGVDEDNTDQFLKAYKNFFLNVVMILEETYPKYKALLDAYNSNLDKLMNPIKATTKGKIRFNDTPQNGGDFSDDEHTSNITKNEVENEVDGASKIERMDEIKRKIAMVMKDWSDEFDGLFIEEGNI